MGIRDRQCLAALEGRESQQRWHKIQAERCEKYLLANGFEKTEPLDQGESYEGNGILVDIADGAITLIDDDGDFCQFALDYYALAGALFTCRIISGTFTHIKP